MLMKPDKAVASLAQPNAIYIGLLVLLAVLVALFGFSRSLMELVRRWTAQEEYSHGFLYPRHSGVAALVPSRRNSCEPWPAVLGRACPYSSCRDHARHG